MTAEGIPILVFRSARPGASFEDRMYGRLSPPRRRTLAAGILAFLPCWGGAISSVSIGRRHGPALFELRLRSDDSRTRLSAFFCTERGALLLLSGAAVTDEMRSSGLWTPGLGDARHRRRELGAAERSGDDALDGLVLDVAYDIKDQSPHTPSPRLRPGARSAARVALVDFRQTYQNVRAEAEKEGSAAVAQLHHAEDRFGTASAVLQARLRSGVTQRRLALLSGLPQAKISRIEGGLANPTLSTLGALARALDVELRIGRPGRQTA